MRLINTHTFQLKEFLDDAIPPYAILSHTWEDTELVYKDMLGGPEVHDSPAFAKIRGCCNIAREFRLDWAWIDTICIDKSSSAELSEAINSMFAWYQASQVCLAYLSDVQWNNFWQGQYKKDALRLLGRSRWFTRGWTLQEILAPSEVVFLDRTWTRFGTKEGFADILESITSIRRVFLVFPQRLSDASVAERLSWASNRQTSRKEDMAYCLLGLLGINMPLLYGEGHRAFHRLQQELIRNVYDHTILAWGLYASPFAQLKYIVGSTREAPPLLAPIPSAFDNWSSANRTLGEGKHYVLTNLGLYIELLVVPFHTPDELDRSKPDKRAVAPALGLALLDCYEWSPRGKYRVALPLQLQDRSNSHVAPLARRARAARPFLVPEHVEQLGRRLSMYLQDGIRAKNVQTNAMWFINCQALFAEGYYLADYFPPTQVDVIQQQGARSTTLCLYSEPGVEYSLIRLQHKEYATVLLLIEHPKAAPEARSASSTTLRLNEKSSGATQKSGHDKTNTKPDKGPEQSAMGQLWITSTDNLKTAFEMVLQPSYAAISFDYIIKEFQWTPLGNIASSLTRGTSGASSLSSSAQASTWTNPATASFRHSASSSLSSTPYPALAGVVGDSHQTKVIDSWVLDKIGALQVVDPVLFPDDEDVGEDDDGTENSGPPRGTDRSVYADDKKDRQRAERRDLVIELAMRVQETSWHYSARHPS
ncbi:heterokaryon incompatibility protein-domain-containing protein [Microdochium trichocladiopsis]|uniref:Heterokaryon incompatibility protein-domain-containing protein n=1 Tax=Microdochium trichocladiopsis TaxID=1682393 RepID=A0A9P8XUE2_9PEZI|nr:heterokaryon incompatibility protein-domain-containing protein [Microdochium trichocladiopsis]KAH7018309.1 heterokaryon incompatibility protein-domain-containing protein [Microdochium trichocladiopsis]